jgi:hypothetical protein
MSAAEPDQSGSPRSFEEVTSLQALTTHTPTPEQTREDARKSIAHNLVLAYVALLGFSIIIPMGLMFVPHVITNSVSVSDARDLMLAMSGALSGLVGILGFVMGYYFKELDKQSGAAASGKGTRRGTRLAPGSASGQHHPMKQHAQ